MKSIPILLLLGLISVNLHAQAPSKMSYQAIVRASDNSLITNSSVSIRILIRQGSANGASNYEELHTAETNINGLVSLEIGTGNSIAGSFNEIPWENGPFFVETQIDPEGGSNYAIIGVSQLLSVPYALHSQTAERIVNNSGTSAQNAEIITFTSSRNINSDDIGNTIACTNNATLTLTTGFSDMRIGDTINLEAHNGANLIVQASSGVAINYTDNGSGRFESEVGNVRFGLLRKTDSNAYIISGQ